MKRTPLATGRLWFYWTAAVVTLALLAPRLHRFDVNVFAAFVLNLVIWGGLAFAAGWGYGKWKSRNDLPSGHS